MYVIARCTGAAAGGVLVAGSVGPYGACQGDGSEYTGAHLDTLTEEQLVGTDPTAGEDGEEGEHGSCLTELMKGGT